MIFKKVVLIAISVLSVIGYCSTSSNEVIESNKVKEDESIEVVVDSNDVSLNKNAEEISKKEADENKTSETNKESITSSPSKVKEEKEDTSKSKQEVEITPSNSDNSNNNNNNQIENNKPNTKVEETKPVEKPVEKPIEKPKNYDIGNCGILYNTENEAYAAAEKKFDDLSDPTKYVSSYLVYSSYDKWTINYYYTYW